MASLTATSVVSAAIISGDLIIGLSDGSVINCGRCQGPQGLDGPQGAIGSTGRSGQDGNTILTSEGTPRPDLGVVGDYVIDKTKWNIYGPKSSGGWGSPTPLRGNGKGAAATKRDLSDGVPTTGEGGGGGGLRYNTSNLPLTGFGRGPKGGKASISADGGNIIEDGHGLSYQSNLNKWVYESLQALDKAVPVALVDSPRPGAYEGELGFYQGDLYLWANSKWEIIGGGASVEIGETSPATPEKGDLWFCTAPDDLTLYIYDGDVWVPAAPPVSLDGVQSAIASIDEQLMKVNANVAMNKSELDEKALDIQLDQDRQDAEIQDLHEKIDGIAEEFDRGKWTHVTEKPTVGQYALGVKATKEYCQDQYAKCVEDADGDPTKLSVCTRQMGDCENEEDAGGSVYVSRWGQVDHISIHTEESDGETHGFGDYTADKYIEIVNEGDEGNATYIITEDAKIEDGVAIVAVSDIQSTGAPSGLGRFKVFEMKSGDPTGYVRKTGDTIDGTLTIERTRTESNSNSLRIKGRVKGVEGKNLLKDYQRALSSDKSDYIEYFGSCDSKDSIANRDQIKALIQEFAIPAKPTPTPFTWTLEKHSNDSVSQGCMAWEQGKFIVLSQTTFEGVSLKKPQHLPSGANEFASYRVPSYTVPSPNQAKNMQIWMEYSTNNWELVAWMTPFKYRFWYKGWVQIEYTNKQGSMPDEYGKRFGVTLPELF